MGDGRGFSTSSVIIILLKTKIRIPLTTNSGGAMVARHISAFCFKVALYKPKKRRTCMLVG